jgi:hypothetical protein
MKPLIERAFVGYKLAQGELFIRICCACPDKDSLESWAHAKGTRITHTYCPSCAAKMLEKIAP